MSNGKMDNLLHAEKHSPPSLVVIFVEKIYGGFLFFSREE
jgi:hypothetical protein